MLDTKKAGPLRTAPHNHKEEILMSNSTIYTQDAAVMQPGPISGDMFPALLNLSAMIHLFPVAQAVEARRLLHSLFDCHRRVAELEGQDALAPQEHREACHD